jgi:hypothetical protein
MMTATMTQYDNVHNYDHRNYTFYLNNTMNVSNPISHMTRNIDDEKVFYVVLVIFQIIKYCINSYVTYHIFCSVSYTGIWTKMYPNTNDLKSLQLLGLMITSILFIISLSMSIVIYEQFVWHKAPNMNIVGNIWYYECDTQYIPILNSTVQCVQLLNCDDIGYQVYLRLISWKHEMIAKSMLSMMFSIVNYIICLCK